MANVIRNAYRSSLAAALVVSLHLLIVGAVVAEQDHLKGYKGRDLDKIQPLGNYTVTNQFGSESCELKKAKFLLVQSEKNAGDDPRGGPPGNFICYKAKCSGTLPPETELDDQFGVHTWRTKKAQLLCVPAVSPTCGNNVREGTEACDGSDDTACPNDCLPDCTCAICPIGGAPDVCIAYGQPGPCNTCVGPQPACAAAVSSGCTDGVANDSCGLAANAAGCAAECGCP